MTSQVKEHGHVTRSEDSTFAQLGRQERSEIKGAAAKVAHTAKAWTGAASQRARDAASELAEGVSAAPNVAAHVADALRETVWNATAELAEEALGIGRSESVQTIRTVVRGLGLLALPLLLIFVLCVCHCVRCSGIECYR